MPYSESMCTVIKNPTAVEQYYDFIPEWMGRTLAAGATKNFPGDIRTIVCLGPQPEQDFPALMRALENDTLVILKTPGAIVYDETDELVLELNVDNGALSLSEPSWDDTDS